MKYRHLQANFTETRPRASVYIYVCLIGCSLLGLWCYFNFSPEKQAENDSKTASAPIGAKTARERAEQMRAKAKSAAFTLKNSKSPHFSKKPQNPAPLQPSTENSRQNQTQPDAPRLGTQWAKETEPHLRNFSRWAGKYVNASPSARSRMNQEGIKFAQTRRKAMTQLIRTNPKRALAVAIPPHVQAELPEDIQLLLEKQISGIGKLDVLAKVPSSDDFSTSPLIERFAHFESETYNASVFGSLAGSGCRNQIPMEGVVIDDWAALAYSPLLLLDPGEPLDPNKKLVSKLHPINRLLANRNLPVSSPSAFGVMGNKIYCLDCLGSSSSELGSPTASAYESTGTKNLLVIKIDFPDVQGDPMAASQINQILEEVDSFFRANSYGKFSFNLKTVTTTLRLNNNASFYQSKLDVLMNDARAAASSAGYNNGEYEFDIVLFDDISIGSWGKVGAKGSWIEAIDSLDARTFAHELGHNLGLWHANSWESNTSTPDDKNGVHEEYGNIFDIMGQFWRSDDYISGTGMDNLHINSNFKRVLGWVESSDITSITGNGTHRIYCIDGSLNNGRKYALRIPTNQTLERADGSDQSGLEHWVEFRHKSVNVYPGLTTGALIFTGDETGIDEASKQLDMVPSGGYHNWELAFYTGRLDSLLPVGSSFTNRGNRWKIEVTAIGGSGANSYLDITVTDLNLPAISTHPVAAGVASGASHTIWVSASGGTLSYQWRRNGSDISMATGPSYTISSFGLSDEGNYDVRVSNSTGSVYSESVVLFQKPGSALSSAGSENFSGTTRDSTKWGPSDLIQGSGRFSRNDRLYYYTQGSSTADDWAIHQWHSQSLPYNEDWAVQTDVNLPSLAMNPDSSASVGLFLLNQADPDDNAQLSLSRAESAGAITHSFSAELDVNDSTVVEKTASNSTTSAAVQYRWDSATQTLYFEYDANGATGGYTWTVLKSVTLNTGSTDWGMPSNSAFIVSGLGLSSNLTVATENNVWLDNFAISGYPPVITTHPASQTITTGKNVTFTVAASGTGLTYQWQKNNANISSATSTSYTISTVASGDAATYRCIVRNTAGSVTSDGAALTVTTVPVISTHPTDTNATVGSNVTFSVAAVGTATLFYQWQKDGVNISDANGTNYTITNAQSDDNGTYRAVVTNAYGTDTSNGAVLKVGIAPSITTQPAARDVVKGSNVTFTVVATGSTALIYQWQKNDVNISDANGTSYTLTNVASGDEGTYRCMVYNGFGTTTSTGAALIVGTAPAITAQPASRNAIVGSNVTFSVTATGTASLTYQWQKNGANLPAANSASYTLSSVSVDDNGTYRCLVSNKYGSATSNGATLAVGYAPVISAHPTSADQVVGSSVTFSVSLSAGTSPISYQWQKNNVNLSGATRSSYVISSLTVDQNGTYRCVISNAFGSANSNGAVLTVGIAPAIATQPASQNAVAGSSPVFSVAATGTAPFSYQWQKNNVNLSGAIGSSFTLSNVQLDANGTTYRCIVSNKYGTVTSSSATLTVGNAPVIASHPSPADKVAGSSVTFSVAISVGTAPIAYQWQKNGANISGATSLSYTIGAISASDAGTYRCVISNAFGSATSNGAVLTVGIAPAIATQPASQNAVAGSSPTFSVAATGTAPFSYQWQKNNVNLSGAIGSSFTLSNVQLVANGMTYRCIVSNKYGSATSNSATLAVGFVPVISTHPVATDKIVGSSVTFSVALSAGTAPISYQWQMNNVSISGATSISYTINSLGASHAGTYRCVVSSAFGQATSNGAFLTVGNPPTISAHPADLKAPIGSNPTFTVTASGTEPLAYQWQKNSVNITSATNASHSITNVAKSHIGTYRCIVSNKYAAAISNHATLDVGTPPSIIQSPTSAANLMGDRVTFSAAAIGDDPLTHQWLKDNVNLDSSAAFTIASYFKKHSTSDYKWFKDTAGNWVYITSNGQMHRKWMRPDIKGRLFEDRRAHNYDKRYWSNPWLLVGRNFFTIDSAQAADAGNYKCQIQNRFGSATTAAAALTISTPPTLTAQPNAENRAVAGNNFTFSITADGTGTLSYQWQKNGNNITDATSNSYTINNVKINDTGTYHCTVTSPHGQAVSRRARLTIHHLPVISVHPVAQTAPVSDNITFSVTAKGSGPLTFQWQREGANLTGANGFFLSRYHPEYNGAQRKWLKGANDKWYILTPTGTLTEYVTFKKVAQFDAGAWANPKSLVGPNHFTLFGVKSSDAGQLRCVVSNAGSATSKAAQLTVEID